MKPIPRPDMETVYEHYGLIIRGADRGGWRKAQCPLPDHEDINPSASVIEDHWHCNACDEGGDAIDIIQRRDGVGFAAAVEIASRLAGDGDGAVRTGSHGELARGILPRQARGGGAGRPWLPPWKR